MLQVPFRYSNWYRPLEQKYLSRDLEQHFGYELLLIGNSDLKQVESSPVANHYAVREQKRMGFYGVVSRFNELPFEPDSIDVMVLAHALDHCENPASVIRETYKTLRHDGTLIVTGFNCWRSLAKTLWRFQSRQYKTEGQLQGVSAVRVALQKQGFEVMKVKRFGAFASRWGNRSLLDKLLLRCLPFLCTGYVLVAKKQGIRLQPVKFKSQDVLVPKQVVPGSSIKRVNNDS